MKEVVIAGYLRTAQSRSRPAIPPGTGSASCGPMNCWPKCCPKSSRRTGIDAKEINDFIVGCATAVGEQWAFGGRMPIFLADLPETIPAKFVDQQCGSAMAAIQMGFMEIAQEFADIVLVGGYEHMTRVPMGGVTFDRGYVHPTCPCFMEPGYPTGT